MLRKRLFVLILICTVFLAQFAYADYLTTAAGPIEVSFHYNSKIQKTVVDHSDFQTIFKVENLPKNVGLEGYKIDIWVFTALQKLKLPFDGITKSDGFSYKTTITDVDGYKNNDQCRWIYYVNGYKSPYTISTQLDAGVEVIKFVYECSKK